jgi:hypothetical protein
MKKLVLTLLIACIVIINSSAQIVFEDKKGLVSKATFNKKVTQDFSYLLLGDNSPQQGISATLNDNGSNIKINGLLYSGKRGILSLEADLAASNGVYFFDEENGSEKARISLNYYKKIWYNSEYLNKTPVEKMKTKLEVLSLIADAKSKYDFLNGLMKQNFSELQETNQILDNRVVIELKRLSREYINSQDDEGYKVLPKKTFDESLYDQLISKLDTATIPMTILSKTNGIQEKKDFNITSTTRVNLQKLLKDYVEHQMYILEELEDKIITLELKDAEAKWTSDKVLFFGITPFYQRESFRRFTFDESVSFANMFGNEIGDIYGVIASLSFNYERGENQKTSYKPNKFFVRVTAGVNRASNISGFRNNTLNLTTPVGDDVNGNPIIFTNTDAAFIGDATYEYGAGSNFVFDLYYYPFNIPVGLFGILGYQYVNFSSDKNIKDKEIIPLRLGMLFNLKNKKKDSPLVTVQAFIDRTDLNLSPNGNDNDLRFGIGIGLPVNIR